MMKSRELDEIWIIYDFLITSKKKKVFTILHLFIYRDVCAFVFLKIKIYQESGHF